MGVVETRSEKDFFGVVAFGKLLLQFVRRIEGMTPSFVLLLEASHQKRHLVFIPRGSRSGHAATDIGALGRAGTERNVNMQMIRVMVDSVGVANRIVGMKSFSEFAHDLFHRDL